MMILALAAVLLSSSSSSSLSPSPSSSSSQLPGLAGTDTVPHAALRATASAVLLAVARDAAATPLARARALRVLARRVDVDDAAFAAARAACAASPVFELRVQAVLAGADRARDPLAYARAALNDPDRAVRRGALVVLQRTRSPQARALAAVHHDVDADNAALAAAIARSRKATREAPERRR